MTVHGLDLVGECDPDSSSREISSRSRCSDSAAIWLAWAWACSVIWRALASASARIASRLGLGVGLGLVHELLGQEQGALQGVVGHRRVRRGRRSRLLLELGLELRDALGGLAQPFAALAELLLEPLGLHGGFLEVLVDVVPVVPLQGLAELDGTERIEGRLRSVHAVMLAA